MINIIIFIFKVLCASSLLSHTVSEVSILWTNVLFYVNIADTDILESLNYYIACKLG